MYVCMYVCMYVFPITTTYTFFSWSKGCFFFLTCKIFFLFSLFFFIYPGTPSLCSYICLNTPFFFLLDYTDWLILKSNIHVCIHNNPKPLATWTPSPTRHLYYASPTPQYSGPTTLCASPESTTQFASEWHKSNYEFIEKRLSHSRTHDSRANTKWVWV